MRHGVILFLAQTLLNLIGTINIISTASYNIPWTVITDIITAIVGYTAIKEIVQKGDGIWKMTGFTLGAVTGSVIGIYVSKAILR